MLWLMVPIAGALIFYVTLILPTQWLKVEQVRHPLASSIRILHISDLHVERIRVSPSTVLGKILRERPDIICLTGDYMDEHGSFRRFEDYLEVIRESNIPAFAVLGNHDYKLSPPDVTRLAQLFESYGVCLLRNESVVHDGICVIGIDDFDSGHHNIDQAFSKVLPELPTLVLTHDPNIVLELRRPYDYLLSGHLHGKQFNVPFLFRLNPMGPLPAKGIYKGTHDCAYGRYYISKGIGQSGYNFRFFVRSEITVHLAELKK